MIRSWVDQLNQREFSNMGLHNVPAMAKLEYL